jgi:dolichol kinase
MLKIILIAPCAAFFGWLGVMALRYPSGLLRGFGIVAAGPDAANEIRAVYGGLPLTMSAALLVSLVRPELRNPAALAVAAASLGMALGRVASAVIDQKFGRLPVTFFVVELGVAAALVGAYLVRRA